VGKKRGLGRKRGGGVFPKHGLSTGVYEEKI